MTAERAYYGRFGGCDWNADLPLSLFDSAPTPPVEAIMVRRQQVLPERAVLRRIGRAAIAQNGLRFDWEDEMSFDLSDDLIGWMAKPGWRGQLPVAFFSSLAAIALAWQGRLPLHASAVVRNDRAWLIAGSAGAGKSTLAAELVAAGNDLLGDDLTILSLAPDLTAWRGRPAMRLHPESARQLPAIRPPEDPGDPRGKFLVWPAARAADRGWPVGGLLLLGGQGAKALSAPEAAAAYGSILFRPKILSALPGRAQLRAGLLELARHVPVALLPAVQGFGAADRACRLSDALSAIDRLQCRGI